MQLSLRTLKFDCCLESILEFFSQNLERAVRKNLSFKYYSLMVFKFIDTFLPISSQGQMGFAIEKLFSNFQKIVSENSSWSQLTSRLQMY